MKIVSILTRIIPTLNAVKGAKVFNVVISTRAPAFAEELRVAANKDGIAVSALLGAMKTLSEATGVEDQQVALADAIMLSDTLLGQIAAGEPPHADRIPLTTSDLIKEIANDIDSIRDVFAPKAETLRRIRMNASEVASLVTAEVIEKERPDSHASYAAIIFDQADRLEEESHAGREHASTLIAKNIKLLAA